MAKYNVDEKTMEYVIKVLHSIAYDIRNGNVLDELDLMNVTDAIERLTGEEWNEHFIFHTPNTVAKETK